MSIKKTLRKVHLWLGLASGVIVFIIAITGCLYAFQVEIQDAIEDFRFVEKQDREFQPPSVLIDAAQKKLDGKELHAVLYNGPTRAATVIYYSFDPEYYYLVYVNPYSAEVLKVKDMEQDFFHIVLDGHFYLWLPPSIGQPVVASATLVFVAMLITGLVLWWPKKQKEVKQRFSVKWSARWRRINYDLHNVLGFYASAIALVLALTGLVWGFQWFANGVYRISGGEKNLTYSEPTSDTTHTYQGQEPAIDRVFALMQKQYPEAETLEVHTISNNASTIGANANPDIKTFWKIDYRYFDQHSLKEVSVDHIYGRFPEAKAADKLIRMNYDIHTGAIFGLAGKFLMFFASLIIASLPVTGTCIWWGRRNKKKHPVVKDKKNRVAQKKSIVVVKARKHVI
jgi:uncharacterized iron-regulated membrane protein